MIFYSSSKTHVIARVWVRKKLSELKKNLLWVNVFQINASENAECVDYRKVGELGWAFVNLNHSYLPLLLTILLVIDYNN